MTEMLYSKDSYAKEFDAIVTSVEGRFVVLDKTAFYPQSRGQPSDEGKLVCESAEYKVVFAKKIGDDISHEVDNECLKKGDKVHGTIDWERRYRLMRYHTAAHLLADVIEREANALITGNQLGLDKSRIDFNLENFDREKLKEYEVQVNKIIERALPVEISELPRDEAMKIPSIFKLKNVLPPTIDIIRIVDVKEINKQACGGTHVRNTKEVGHLEIISAENKGKENRRLYFKLSDN
ncbi:MAG: alanyl-tRNA editing protein [Nanoarchaeota archaeon]|nr:alanyl-tRNA editing protein [Nanoarchaeota archaeon]